MVYLWFQTTNQYILKITLVQMVGSCPHHNGIFSTFHLFVRTWTNHLRGYSWILRVNEVMLSSIGKIHGFDLMGHTDLTCKCCSDPQNQLVSKPTIYDCQIPEDPTFVIHSTPQRSELLLNSPINPMILLAFACFCPYKIREIQKW